MAEAVARSKYIRIAPRKARLVADAVRGKRVDEARSILKFNSKKASKIILRLLNDAVANAEQKKTLDISSLYVRKIVVNGGTMLSRFKARAMGRATTIRHRTSHIEIVLAEE